MLTSLVPLHLLRLGHPEPALFVAFAWFMELPPNQRLYDYGWLRVNVRVSPSMPMVSIVPSSKVNTISPAVSDPVKV